MKTLYGFATENGMTRYLVNLDRLVKYFSGRSGSIQLSTGDVLEVAQRKKDELLKRFSK